LKRSLSLIALALAATLAAGCGGAGSTSALSAPSAGNGAAQQSGARALMVAVGHTASSTRSTQMIFCPACGGGDGDPTPPPRPIHTPPPGSVGVEFDLTVPAHTDNPKPRAHARAPQSRKSPRYVSQVTQSFQMQSAQNGAVIETEVGACTPNPDNTSTCTVNMAPMPNQSYTFTATLFDGSGASGNVLGIGSQDAYIQQGVANNVTVNVDPLIAEADFFLNDPVTGAPGQSSITLHANQAANFTGGLVVYDVDGYQVPDNVPAVNYRDPSGNIIAIVPSISYTGGSNTITLSPASFAGHASGLTFSGSYNGGATSSATLTPVIGSESGLCTDPVLAPVCVTPATVNVQ
jgi:hypothetical protein